MIMTAAASMIRIERFMITASDDLHTYSPNTEISGRRAFWPIRWIDLLDEILLFSTSEGIFPGFRGYQFLNLHLIPASISDSHEAIEQPVSILEFDL